MTEQDIQELLDQLPQKASELKKSLKEEIKAHKIAHQAIKQLDSLTIDEWQQGASHEEQEANLAALFENHDDVITYAKAVTIVRAEIQSRFNLTKNVYWWKWLSPNFRKKFQSKLQTFESIVTSVVLLKYKHDFEERYEVPVSKSKARKEKA